MQKQQAGGAEKGDAYVHREQKSTTTSEHHPLDQACKWRK